MDVDQEKVNEAVLALLYLWSWQEYGAHRTWKDMDWDVMNALHERGWISDPRGKARSVVLSDEGVARAQEFVAGHFQRAG
jgi:hypothetical protein